MARKKDYSVKQRKDKYYQALISRKLVQRPKDRLIIRATKAEVVAEAERKVSEILANGADYQELEPEELRAARVAMKLLADAGFRPTAITDAATEYIQHNDPSSTRKLVRSVIKEYLESKANSNLSAISQRDYRQKLIRFGQKFGGRYINGITASQIERWLNDIKAKGVSRKRYRSHISMLFMFAIRRKYAKDNPVEGVQKVRVVDAAPPIILSVSEAGALMKTALEHKKGDMVPFFAISLFAGLRPGEVQKLAWSAIDLDKKTIHVGAGVASKTKRQRYIEDIPDNLIAWLKLTPKSQRKGRVYYSQSAYNTIRVKAKLKDKWRSGNSVMRHTCASYLLPVTGNNTPLVSRQCGHSISVLESNYLHAVTKEDAQEFFAIQPEVATHSSE